LGLLPFDDEHDGVESGHFVLDLRAPLSETLRAQFSAIATTGDDEQNPVDITEAFIEWRPYPQSQWRWRAKLGAFYPPISLENRGVGWQSLYSLSPSAINTWVGGRGAIGRRRAIGNQRRRHARTRPRYRRRRGCVRLERPYRRADFRAGLVAQ
jgi:hypothetical protein